eukprot:SAG25_NODE_619_length_6424_cov_11.572174_8_plen_395_part_01
MLAADNAQHAAAIHLAVAMNNRPDASSPSPSSGTVAVDHQQQPGGEEDSLAGDSKARALAKKVAAVWDADREGRDHDDRTFVEQLFSSEQRQPPDPSMASADSIGGLEAYRSLQQERTRLEAQLRSAREQLLRESAAKQAATKRADEASNRHEQTQAELRSSRAECHGLATQLRDARTEAAQLQVLLQEANGRAKASDHAADHAKQNYVEKSRELSTCQAECEVMRVDLQQAKLGLQSFQASSCKKTQAALDEVQLLRAELERARALIRTATANEQAHDEAVAEQRTQIVLLQQQLNAAQLEAAISENALACATQQRRQQMEAAAQRAILRWRFHEVANVFYPWVRWTTQHRQARLLGSKVCRRLQNMSLAAAVDAWRGYVTQQQWATALVARCL